MAKEIRAVKELLGQIKRLDVRINNKLEEMANLKALAYKVTTTLRQDAAFGGGGNGDKVGDAVAKIIELENSINDDIDELVDKKREISAIIERVQNVDQYDVLHQHYFLHKSLEKIAQERFMSYRNVCYIHGRALQTVATILEDERI